VRGDIATIEPGARPPAPEPLRLVQRFVNSNDRERGRDAFASQSALADWLRDAGLPGGRLDQAALARAIALREALRALLLANNGLPLDEAALATLNAEASRSGVAVRFTAANVELELAGRGLDRALGQIIATVFQAMLDGTWSRLKACRREACRWVFYDHSKNRSGSWCTMDICGNRVKTSAYWRRRRSARGRSSPGKDRLAASRAGRRRPG
jgi:predicted RNA-binding Zn ribbon-like protein